MQDDKNLPSENGLDQAARDALQLEQDPQRLERMEQFWKEQSRRQSRRQVLVFAVPAAAAAILIAVGSGLFWKQLGNSEITEKPDNAPPVPIHVASEPAETLVSQDIRVEASSFSRPATAYERMVFISRTKETDPTLPFLASVDQVIDKLIANQDMEVEQAFASLKIQPSVMERVLLRSLPQASTSRQAVILRCLAVYGTERSVPALLRIGQRDKLCDEAMEVIEQIVDSDQLAEVVPKTKHQHLRLRLMQRLITANSGLALKGFLSLVGNDLMRSEALAVAREAHPLPIDSLMLLLDDKDKQVRLSAALVLGHVNGPVITKKLIDRVMNQPADSTEAWLALMTCRGDNAQEFLAFASLQPRLLGHCNHAWMQWIQIAP